MITTKSKKSNKCPETLQIKRKVMAVIKLALKDSYFSNKTSYNNRNIIALKTSNHAMKRAENAS
jgi:hypothetical protein